MKRKPRRSPRIGLALAGGGPLGAIYEIGALCALEEALPALDLTACQGYVGVSAGAIVAAGLANGIGPRALCAAFIEQDGDAADLLHPALLMRPAWSEYLRRAAMLPGRIAQAGWRFGVQRRSVSSALEALGAALPNGLFDGAALEAQLRRLLSAPGRSNDFRALPRRLVLMATELDRGEAVPFGLPGHDHVPISLAAQASAALPGLYAPVTIDGRHHVDGVLTRTLHARVLLDEGLDLLLCLNPVVPFDALHLQGRIPRLAEGGLPIVLSQTLRTLIRSRLEIGLQGYGHSHPDTDIVLFEPDPHDAEMYLANTFGVSRRRALAEHAYQRTRAMLRARADTLSEGLRRHGLEIDRAVLADRQRHLVMPPSQPERASRALMRLSEVLDDLERALPAAAR